MKGRKDRYEDPMKIKDDLFLLVKSLNKEEKRNFKRLASLQEGDNKLYVRLFELLDKNEEFDKVFISQTLENEFGTRHFSVAKNYLFNFLLKSLSFYNNHPSYDAANKVNHIRILLHKRQYPAALKLATRVRKKASDREQFNELIEALHLEIQILFESGFEKNLEGRINVLSEELNRQTLKTENLNYYRQLCYQAKLIVRGMPLGETERDREFWQNRVVENPAFHSPEKVLSSRALIFFYRTWYYHFRYRLNHQECREYNRKILEIYHTYPFLIDEDRMEYVSELIKGLGLSEYLGNEKEFKALFQRIKALRLRDQEEQNLFLDVFLMSSLNFTVTEGKIARAESEIMEFSNIFEPSSPGVGPSRLLFFYYHAAVHYIQSGRPREALKWINLCLALPKSDHGKLLQGVVRLLNLIILFELQMLDLLENQLLSCKRYYAARNQLMGFPKEFIALMNQLLKAIDAGEQGEIIKKAVDNINFSNDTAPGLRYQDCFNFSAWLKSKVENRSMIEILADKAKD